MPKRRGAWSAWNYLGRSEEIAAVASKGQAVEAKPVFVTYWLNKVSRQGEYHCCSPTYNLSTMLTLVGLDPRKLLHLLVVCAPYRNDGVVSPFFCGTLSGTERARGLCRR